MLTISDDGQKHLRLKEGTFSADVKPQRPGKPMLIHTRTATLEVVGTQFNVDAGRFATTLNVSEGNVRVERLSDGDKIDVPAGFRIVAAPDQEMSLVPLPDSVTNWKSQLNLGPERAYGKWAPGTNDKGAELMAGPFTIENGKTIYTAALQVSIGDNPPVVLVPNSKIRVRGHIASAHPVFFGVTVQHASGEFAGRFQVILPADRFHSDRDFEVVLDLRDYSLDPSLAHIKDKLPSVPFSLTVDTIWCHTLFDPAGLAILEVELLGPSK